MKKHQKKHLFARTCRVLGRFLLALGAVLCVASIVLALAPLLFPSQAGEVDTISHYPPSFIAMPTNPSAPAPASDHNSAAYILPAIISVVIILATMIIAFCHYNSSIRTAIARFAKTTKLNIHTSELLLSTFIWAIVNLILIFNAPVFALLSFAALVLNNLFFIFAWTAYGCPSYSI